MKLYPIKKRPEGRSFTGFSRPLTLKLTAGTPVVKQGRRPTSREFLCHTTCLRQFYSTQRHIKGRPLNIPELLCPPVVKRDMIRCGRIAYCCHTHLTAYKAALTDTRYNVDAPKVFRRSIPDDRDSSGR